MRVYGILIFFLSVFNAGAQHLNFFKPEEVKQLPSSESYNIMQDSRGYIWFSTEAGLCRYNGNSVKVYNGKEGLREAATYNVWEDEKGKLWMTTSLNRVLYYDLAKDSMVEAPFSKACVKLFNKRLEEIYLARLASDGGIWLCSQNLTAKVNLVSNTITEVKATPDILHYVIDRSIVIPVKSQIRLSEVNKKNTLHISIEKGDRKVVIPLDYSKRYSPETRVVTATNKKNEYFVGFDRFLIKVNDDLTYTVMETSSQILSLYSDRDDGLWACLYKGGVIYYPDATNENKIISLPELSVSGICEDAEKGIWCTTLEKGVYYCRSKYVLNYSDIPGLDKRADFVKAIGNRVYASSEKSELFEIADRQVTKHQVKTGPGLTDIMLYNDTFIITSKAGMVKVDTSFSKYTDITEIERKTFLGSNQLTLTKEKRIYAVHRASIQEIKGTHFILVPISFKTSTKCVLASNKEGFLLGCADGLYKVDLEKITLKKIPGIESSVIRLYETSDNQVWIATKEAGLYQITNGIIQKVSDRLGLTGLRFSDITQDRLGNLWLASNAGLVQLKKPYTQKGARFYTSRHGLNSNEILKLAASDERIYVSTYDGLCSFPLNVNLHNQSTPAIYVSRTRVNETTFPEGKNVFAYNENNIRITYDILAFKQVGGPQKFLYKVDGLDKRMHYSEGRELSLSNLPPGSYRVTAFGLNSEGMPGAAPASLDLTIRKPFWLTPLFIISALCVLGGLIILVVNRIIYRIRSKEEEKTRVNKLLAEYHMSALRAQMNPHFIFNCINSIQRYVLTNKPEEAYHYLSKFSKLIRHVLNYAEENLITLAQEIEIVELYLELEQKRFENKFIYSIAVDENVDQNGLYVPVLIMQPYIENAIWHGLMNLPKDKTGTIEIKIKLAGELLEIVIEDNGVGRRQAALVSKKTHRSKAVNINNMRSEIMSVLADTDNADIVIEDIKGEDSVAGTRVIIHIPQKTDSYDE